MAGAASARATRGPGATPRRRVQPAPRRPSGRSGIKWDRVGRLALLGVLCAIVLLYIPPIAHWVEQSGTAGREEAQLQQLRAERARLRARLRDFTGPGALERQARRLGMVKAGERPYVIENLPAR
jgi:Septum formation initiator